MDRQIFQDLGLSKGEVEVYISLLEIGISSIGKIVEKSKITKSKVYDILNKLKNKGLVSSFIKNNVQFFNAAPPNFLLEILNKKEEEIAKKKLELIKNMPDLISLKEKSQKQEHLEIFEGFQGLKNAFKIAENEFKENEEFLVFGVDKTLNDSQLKFFVDYHKIRVRYKVKTKVIFTKNLRGIKEYQQKINNLNEERFLNQDSAIPINVYKDIVLIPLLSKDSEEITIVIRNKNFAEGLKKLFYTLWKISKP